MSTIDSFNDLFQQCTYSREDMAAWLYDMRLRDLWDIADLNGIDWESVGMYGMTKRQVIKALMSEKFGDE